MIWIPNNMLVRVCDDLHSIIMCYIDTPIPILPNLSVRLNMSYILPKRGLMHSHVAFKLNYRSFFVVQLSAKLHSSVDSAKYLRTDHWFEPRLGQYSFRELMTVFATGFIPLSPLPVVSVVVMWESIRRRILERILWGVQ